ncbi:PRC-barrel domain containing protein [Halomicrococcus sp. SG-WS-1]|uniref:PRC-barrel domain containing protein n=1 Tax=Halomicrococcus sp. SG-WS-1 TaxID=3439057 RepID=UPI003F78B6F8
MTVALSEEDEGKRVVDADGTEVGVVADVQHGTAHVEADEDRAEEMKTRFDAGEYGENTYALQDDDVASVDDDRLVLAAD